MGLQGFRLSVSETSSYETSSCFKLQEEMREHFLPLMRCLKVGQMSCRGSVA